LKARYPTWEDVRDAPTADVEATIAGVTWPEQKAPRLQAIMRKSAAKQGNLNLDFLKEWPVAQGVEYLSRFEGVGPKTRACVLLFSCRKPILRPQCILRDVCDYYRSKVLPQSNPTLV
jgi:endonuclease-3